MQPYSPHQMNSGAMNPGDTASSAPDSADNATTGMTHPTAADVAVADAAVAASYASDSGQGVLDVPKQHVPGLSGS